VDIEASTLDTKKREKKLLTVASGSKFDGSIFFMKKQQMMTHLSWEGILIQMMLLSSIGEAVKQNTHIKLRKHKICPSFESSSKTHENGATCCIVLGTWLI
jgi:hypothetical protein